MTVASRVDPATTVILTQECQRGIIGDLASPMLRDASEAINMVDNIGRLVAAGRSAGCAVIHCIAELRMDHPAASTNTPIMRAVASFIASPSFCACLAALMSITPAV